ncbi:hypothetical protein BDQ17DRAFT_278670 [Cyathus striatus]|nr:hypothetical protein BDQ17DRAFT_278670 [Cyathus striatus]
MCREYLNPSRKHLFQEVDLSTYYKCGIFHNILISSPNIAGYIRTFTLGNMGFIDPCINPHYNTSRDGHVVYHPALPGIINMLQNIRNFIVIFKYEQNWEDITVELKKEMIGAFSLSTLSKLVLIGIRNFPSIIMQCAVHVSHAIINCVKFSDSLEEKKLLRDQGTTEPRQMALRSLALGRQSLETSKVFADSIVSCNLDTLDILCNNAKNDLVTLIMKQHKDTLMTLILPDFSEEFEIQEYPIDIMPYLQTVTFHINTDAEAYDNITYLLNQHGKGTKLKKS